MFCSFLCGARNAIWTSDGTDAHGNDAILPKFPNAYAVLADGNHADATDDERDTGSHAADASAVPSAADSTCDKYAAAHDVWPDIAIGCHPAKQLSDDRAFLIRS